MATQTEMAINYREVMGKATKRLRKVGIIPANIFGHKEPSQAVQLDAIDFDRLRRSHAVTGIIALRLPDSRSVQTALIRHVQHDPRSGKVIHIDFFRVSLYERLNVKVPLHFVGEAPGVKVEGGVLLHLLDALEIDCLASEIPEYLDVDISGLTEIDSILHAGEIKLPSSYTLLTDPDEGVVKIAASRLEKEIEAAEEAAAAAAPQEAAPGAPPEAAAPQETAPGASPEA
jgi:large subunit ribosomal protein L25